MEEERNARYIIFPGSCEEQHGSEAGGKETEESKDELGGAGDGGSDG